MQYTGFNILKGGSFADFDYGWYDEIGTSLVKTMAIGAVFPIIEFFMWSSLKVLFRILDRGFGCNSYKSKKKSV